MQAPAAGSRLKIFEACIPILSHDTQTSQFLLPYVVQNVVCFGADEARQGVLNEVKGATM
jgi:serine/threonine-protein kinase ATR